MSKEYRINFMQTPVPIIKGYNSHDAQLALEINKGFQTGDYNPDSVYSQKAANLAAQYILALAPIDSFTDSHLSGINIHKSIARDLIAATFLSTLYVLKDSPHRSSGLPEFYHPFQVACNSARLGAGLSGVIPSITHDTPENRIDQIYNILKKLELSDEELRHNMDIKRKEELHLFSQSLESRLANPVFGSLASFQIDAFKKFVHYTTERLTRHFYLPYGNEMARVVRVKGDSPKYDLWREAALLVKKEDIRNKLETLGPTPEQLSDINSPERIACLKRKITYQLILKYVRGEEKLDINQLERDFDQNILAHAKIWGNRGAVSKVNDGFKGVRLLNSDRNYHTYPEFEEVERSGLSELLAIQNEQIPLIGRSVTEDLIDHLFTHHTRPKKAVKLVRQFQEYRFGNRRGYDAFTSESTKDRVKGYLARRSRMYKFDGATENIFEASIRRDADVRKRINEDFDFQSFCFLHLWNFYDVLAQDSKVFIKGVTREGDITPQKPK